jgi:hypothetical protein
MATTATLVGDDVQVDWSYTSLGTEDLEDPDRVVLIHRDPSLVETVYEFGVDDEITKTGEGQYSFVLTIGNQPRTHWFRPWGSGSVNKAQEVTVEVTESAFIDPLPE